MRRRTYIYLISLSLVIVGFLSVTKTLGQTNYLAYTIFEDNGSKGMVDAEGKAIIPAKYFDLGWSKGLPEFHQNVIGYEQSQRWGLITTGNKIVTPPKYVDLFPAENSNLFIASQAGKYSGEILFGVINSNGKVVIPFMFAGVTVCRDAVIAKSLTGNISKYGLLNLSNEPILPFQYHSITPLAGNLLAVTKPDWKIAIMNTRGKEVVRYDIDSIQNIGDGYFNIYKGGEVGLLEQNGNLVLPPKFKKIIIESNTGKISYLNFNEWSFLDIENNTQKKLLADKIIELSPGIFKITKNNQSWIIDMDQTPLTDPYDEIVPVSETHLKFLKNDKQGIIDFNGEEILQAAFDSLYVYGPFIYAMKAIGKREEWNVFDTLGIQRNHFVYQDMKPMEEKLIPVKRNNFWGFISREGIEVIPCVYDHVTPFHNNKSIVGLHGEEGIIDSHGDWIVFPRERHLILINDTLLLEKGKYQNRLITINERLVYFTEHPVSWEGTYLLEQVDSLTNWHISLEGIIINSDAEQSRTISFSDSLFIIYQSGKAGLISSTGRVIVPVGEWDKIFLPSEGLLGIMGDGFYGFIDFDNKLRIANRYEAIGPFREGLAAVKVRGKWGFVNRSEQLVCQPLYDEVGVFINGICMARSEDKWGMISPDGSLIQSLEYDSIERLASGYFLSSKDSEFGLISPNGKTIIFPKYNYLEVLEDQMVLIERRGKFGLLDIQGVNALPTIYESLFPTSKKNTYLSMSPGVWETQASTSDSQ